jgi:hypothetical protein
MRSHRARGPFGLASSLLAVAVTVNAFLPPEHIHLAGIEGRTHSIVHRHSLERLAPCEHGASIAAHGNHERALFLSTLYDSVSRFVTQAPAVLETATIILPSLGSLAPIQADDAQRAHGPPGSPCPTRAPPALA